jgi:hypothetical protein
MVAGWLVASLLAAWANARTLWQRGMTPDYKTCVNLTDLQENTQNLPQAARLATDLKDLQENTIKQDR